MPRTLRLVEQRIAILKMVLEILRTYSGAYFPGVPFGSQCNDMLLIAAVMVGQAERRPMNPSKLSDFAGIPRPTVIRKLKELAVSGVLEIHADTYAIRPARANGPLPIAAVKKSKQLIVNTAALLSKMDR